MKERYWLFKWWIQRKTENTIIWIARHLPREIRRWVVIIACAKFDDPADINYRALHDSL